MAVGMIDRQPCGLELLKLRGKLRLHLPEMHAAFRVMLGKRSVARQKPPRLIDE